MGIRRFATVIDDTDNEFLHLLNIAEAVKDSLDEVAHVQRYRDVLLNATHALKELTQTESLARRALPEHHVSPQQGG